MSVNLKTKRRHSVPLMIYFKPEIFKMIVKQAEKIGGNKSTYIRGLVMRDLESHGGKRNGL